MKPSTSGDRTVASVTGQPQAINKLAVRNRLSLVQLCRLKEGKGVSMKKLTSLGISQAQQEKKATQAITNNCYDKTPPKASDT